MQTLSDGDFDGEGGLSEEEHRAWVKMFQDFIEFCVDNDIIEEDEELEERLEEFLYSIPIE